MKYEYSVWTFGYIHLARSEWRKGQSVKDKDMTRFSLGKFLVVSTFVTRCLHTWKAGRDPSGERWNYLSRRLSCNLPYMTTFTSLSNCFWISEPVLVWTKYFVCVCSTYSLSLPCIRLEHDSCQVMKFVYMGTTCSVAIQNMGIKLELNLMKQLEFILLCLYLMCWIWVRNFWLYRWSNTFNGIVYIQT